jgi:regulator of replication initiation timing
MFKTEMDSKPVDYLAEIQQILAKNSINLSNAPAVNVPVPQAQTQMNNGVSVSTVIEMMGTVQKAQAQASELAIRAQFEAEKQDALKAEVTSLKEQLGALNGTITEVTNEKIQAIFDRDTFKQKFEVASGELAEKENLVSPSEVEVLNTKIGDLEAALQALTEERDNLKSQNEALGAKLAGVGQGGVQGEVIPAKENLSAEEAAKKIVDGELTDDEKLMVEFENLEKLAHTPDKDQGKNVRAYEKFIRENSAKLGIFSA